MNKEKIYKIIRSINLLFILAIFPFMFFAVLLLLGHFDLLFIFLILPSYLIASLFAIIALKKKKFLIISLIAWLVFFVGNILDIKKAKNDSANVGDYVELRIKK